MNEPQAKTPWSGRMVWGGLGCYLLTSALAMAGLVAGRVYLPVRGLGLSLDRGLPFANWDGWWYEKIARQGYTYDPAKPSSVAFFPAYPLAGRLLGQATGLETPWALLIVAHLCLAGSFVVLAAYVRQRFPHLSPVYTWLVLFSFGLWPMTFIFRMTYSEGMFFLCTVLVLYALEGGWPLEAGVGVIGLATAVRPVGVVLVLPLALKIWRESASWKKGMAALAGTLPLAGWGLAAYMAYQWAAFADPLAFVQTQTYWRQRPPVPIPEKLLALATLEPVLEAFASSSPCYWEKEGTDPLVNAALANRFWWLLALGLICGGACKGWLHGGEMALAAGLLLVPYFLKGQEMCMASMGRFAAVAPPLFLVLGHLLLRWPRELAWLALGTGGFFLALYSARFAAWYPFF